jgi:hypothetical protein
MPFGFHYTADRAIDSRWWQGQGGAPLQNPSSSIEGFAELYEQVLSLDADSVLDGCISKCAAAKLVHKDMEWRHVAIFPSSSCVRRSKKKAINESALVTKETLAAAEDVMIEAKTETGKKKASGRDLVYCFIDLTRMQNVETPERATELMTQQVLLHMGPVSVVSTAKETF